MDLNEQQISIEFCAVNNYKTLYRKRLESDSICVALLVSKQFCPKSRTHKPMTCWSQDRL